MAVTRLIRKLKRRRAAAVNRKKRIKQLTRKPAFQNVDIEAIKAEFAAKKGETTSAPAKKEAPKAEAKPAATPAKPEAKAEQEQTTQEKTTKETTTEETTSES